MEITKNRDKLFINFQTAAGLLEVSATFLSLVEKVRRSGEIYLFIVPNQVTRSVQIQLSCPHNILQQRVIRREDNPLQVDKGSYCTRSIVRFLPIFFIGTQRERNNRVLTRTRQLMQSRYLSKIVTSLQTITSLNKRQVCQWTLNLYRKFISLYQHTKIPYNFHIIDWFIEELAFSMIVTLFLIKILRPSNMKGT